MTGVDVNDPNFDGGQRYSAGRAVAFSSGDNARTTQAMGLQGHRDVDIAPTKAAPDVVSTAKVPCGRSCNGLQAKAPAGTHATEVRGTAAPAAGTAACLVASETKITAVKSRFTVMEDECAAPMVSARDGWHPDSRTERQRREPPSADCEGSLTLDLAGSSARGS
ncbi:hypothetical protein C6341_g12427 [Phytophthora cactorum]|nr:hypothetical protein C6341_g12427 [Phytophthora cactorum]